MVHAEEEGQKAEHGSKLESRSLAEGPQSPLAQIKSSHSKLIIMEVEYMEPLPGMDTEILPMSNLLEPDQVIT